MTMRFVDPESSKEFVLALDHDTDFHEHDANAQWKSPSRKIIEAEITGYEVELAGLRGTIDIRFGFTPVTILEAKIDALKLLATKFE